MSLRKEVKNMNKEKYLEPVLNVIEFLDSDIIRTSVDEDENQGEWDEQ